MDTSNHLDLIFGVIITAIAFFYVGARVGIWYLYRYLRKENTDLRKKLSQIQQNIKDLKNEQIE